MGSKQFIVLYQESSSSLRFYPEDNKTVGDAKREAKQHLGAHLKDVWDLDEDPTHPQTRSIILASERVGFGTYVSATDDTLLNDVAGEDRTIYVMVPTRPVPHSDPTRPVAPPLMASWAPEKLGHPVLSAKENLRNEKENADRKWEARFERLAATLKDELNKENATRENERKKEEAAKERERKKEEAAKERERKKEEAAKERERKKEAAALERKWDAANNSLKETIESLNEEVKSLKEENKFLNEEVKSLNEEVKSLKEENKFLNKKIATFQDESVSRNDDMTQRWSEIEKSTGEVVEWVVEKDTRLMDRIKLRALLDAAQQRLAEQAGVASSSRDASRAWRMSLGPSNNISDRIAEARKLLSAPTVQLDDGTKRVLQTSECMAVVSDADSPIRLRGDKAAHPLSKSRKDYAGPLARLTLGESTKTGLQVLVDLICED